MILIPNWRDAWRMTSVNLPAIGLFLLAFLEAAPHAVLSVYATLPDSIRDTFPEETLRWIGYAIIAAGFLSRVIRQPTLAARKAALGAEGQPDLPRSDHMDG